MNSLNKARPEGQVSATRATSIGCIVMKLEEMATVESVNGKGVRNQFACYHRNFMIIERLVDYVIRFLGGQVACEDQNSLKAEVVVPRILCVHGIEDWCKCRVNIRCRCRGKVQGSCWGLFWGDG